MLETKYSKLLTVILVIVILAIIGLLAFLGFDYYQKYFINKDAQKFVEEYQNQTSSIENTLTNGEQDFTNATNPIDSIEKTPEDGSSSGKGGNKTRKYKGFDVAGTISIPKTKVSYPVLTSASKNAIAVAVGIEFGPGLNMPGNTIIAGHNYRNGLFFSNNKKLNLGDEIYITDNEGNKVRYVIYNKYETTAEDTEYMLRDTQGVREISLTTCLDDSSKGRLIIWAKAE